MDENKFKEKLLELGDTYEDNTHILTCPDTENLDIHQLRHRIHHTVLQRTRRI